MDLATIIGIVSGLVIFIWAIYMGGTLSAFINIPSALIVFGGVLAATLVNYPLSKLIDVLKILKIVFMEKQMEAGEVIKTIVNLAETARREGLLALEEAAYQLKDDFMQKGILLIVDGTDPELVKSILETELAFLEERHREGQSIFETMGALAPAFGLIGTIIGLINMLKQLDNPSAVGPGMAVALITTFYGATFANLLFIPIAGKLKVRSREEILLKQVMIEGMLSIQAGENPRIIEEKLKAFLSPKKRNNLKPSNRAESGEDLAWQQTTK
ncbi:flagellar motor protein [Thermoanaerobacterium sp. DL9XJH110]|jgi:chemotaxis protein MotA|uniref:flagellar motor protein n=1 Tax=Thermoanaerobacterium sp. DL9XJH110 TaxID=3386643 RepID=UPI003BB5D70D